MWILFGYTSDIWTSDLRLNTHIRFSTELPMRGRHVCSFHCNVEPRYAGAYLQAEVLKMSEDFNRDDDLQFSTQPYLFEPEYTDNKLRMPTRTSKSDTGEKKLLN